MNMCVLEILEFHCHRIFLNGYINNFILNPKQNQIYMHMHILKDVGREK